MRLNSMQPSLDATSFLDVFLAWSFILANEVLSGVASEPICHLGEFFAKTVNGLEIHVGLGDKLGQGNLVVLACSKYH